MIKTNNLRTFIAFLLYLVVFVSIFNLPDAELFRSEIREVRLDAIYMKFFCKTAIMISVLILSIMSIISPKYIGESIERNKIKDGVKFRLEKIPGPGNERFYFIYEGNNKLLYTDTAEFENGWYTKRKGSLVPEKDITKFNVPKEYC